MKQVRRITFLCNEETIKQLDHIATTIGTQMLNGKTDLSATIRTTIAMMYEKKMPATMKTALMRQVRLGATPEEAAKLKILAEENIKAEREASEQRKQEAICLLMDEASITPHPETGRPSCHYPVFTPVSNHKVTKTWYDEELPLLGDNTPHLQYRGLFGETGPEGKASCLAIITKMGTTPDQL